MMILTFIFGSLISLLGRIGGDMMSLVSYIMSAENFNKNESALLISELGDASKYIRRCIHGDGAISQELGLGNSLDSFDDIYRVENNISTIKQNFTQVINTLVTYNLIKAQLEKQNNHTEEVNMIHVPDRGAPIVYSEVLNKMNAISSNKNGELKKILIHVVILYHLIPNIILKNVSLYLILYMATMQISQNKPISLIIWIL